MDPERGARTDAFADELLVELEEETALDSLGLADLLGRDVDLDADDGFA